MPSIPATTRYQAVIVGQRIAADAWQVLITQADKLVYRGLSLAQVIRPALQFFLANLDLPALDLSQRLARPIQVFRSIQNCAGRTAYGLAQTCRNE